MIVLQPSGILQNVKGFDKQYKTEEVPARHAWLLISHHEIDLLKSHWHQYVQYPVIVTLWFDII